VTVDHSATTRITNARVLTLAGQGTEPLGAARRGTAMRDLGVLEQADVVIEGGRIKAVGRGLPAPDGSTEIHAAGRVLMPGFVDAHTHACFAGSRLDEWEQKLAGAAYLELLAAGGGIMSTVRDTRAATRSQLAELLLARLNRALQEGTTTIEVKSGYGLSTEAELKMLGAISDAAANWPGTVVATACIGHALDPEVDPSRFVDRTIRETLPAVAQAHPGITIDGYCETGAWSLPDTVRLLEAAKDLGCPLRIHADQFNSLGLVGEAVRLGAISVDHLEASTPADLRLLAESDTFGVMLPCSGFQLDGRYGDGRRLLELGGAMTLGTNYNPGSSPCLSVPAAVALGVRGCGLTPAEAITAVTANGAALLGFDDRGTIAPGQRADLVLLSHTDERLLAFEFGGRPVDAVCVSGGWIHPAAPRPDSQPEPAR
jgi:imidazolonepropionase